MLPGYVLRLARTVGHALRAGHTSALETTVLPMRIWPDDIDTFGHVNNGRYLTLMDLGRFDWMTRSGLGRVMLSHRMRPVVAGASIEFRRELRSFQAVELHTRIVTWDERSLYVEQRLERGGQSCARGLVRLVTKQAGRTVPPAEYLALTGFEGPPPEPTELLAPIRPTHLYRSPLS